MILDKNIDRIGGRGYNGGMITLQDLRLISESYTREPWGGSEVSSAFSRLYFVLDGEAYFEENGKQVRLQKNHLYLTPVKQKFGLHDNPEDPLLHTYAHITTLPAITAFTQVAVEPNTPLADAVALWRRHIHSKDKTLLRAILQLLLSCIEPYLADTRQTLPEQIRSLLHAGMSMQELSRRLGYTREHLTRVFKEAYRVTPQGYCRARKMEAGTELLRQGEQIGRVAEALNFSTPYAFSKAFKKHFGLSPRQYQASIKNGG